jgi:hypothetical protein
MSQSPATGQILLEIILDDGPQVVRELVNNLRGNEQFADKNSKQLAKIVGSLLSKLARIGQTKHKDNKWALGPKFQVGQPFELLRSTIIIESKEMRAGATAAAPAKPAPPAVDADPPKPAAQPYYHVEWRNNDWKLIDRDGSAVTIPGPDVTEAEAHEEADRYNKQYEAQHAQMDADPPKPASVILDGDPADQHLFVGYLGGDPKDYPPIHPFADLVPIMPADELTLLSEDIKVNGLGEPVAFWRGQLLDGRNRYIACRMAEVEVVEEHLPNDEDPLGYVFRKNIRRRQLTIMQKAIVAEKAATATKGRKKKDGGALSLDQASDRVGVSRRSTAMVREIKEKDRAVYDGMVNGYYLTINAAARVAGLATPKPRLTPPAPKPTPPAPQPVIVPFPTVDADPPAAPEPEPTPPTVDAEPAQSAAPMSTFQRIKSTFAEWFGEWKGEDRDTAASWACAQTLPIAVAHNEDAVAVVLDNSLSRHTVKKTTNKKKKNGSEIRTATGNGKDAGNSAQDPAKVDATETDPVPQSQADRFVRPSQSGSGAAEV